MKKYAAFLLLPFFTFFSCATVKEVKELQYQDVKNFSIQKLDMEKPEVGLEVQFFNPNTTNLTLKDVDLDIYLNKMYLGKATINKSFNVPANDTFLLPITLIPNLKNAFPNALQLIFNKEVNVQLKGSVKAGKKVMMLVPINYKGTQKLNIF